MELHLDQLNYVAILLATIIYQAIGILWYSRLLFGKIWAEESGFKPNEFDKKEATRGMIFGALLAIFVFFIIAIIVALVGVKNWASGAMLGLILGLLVYFQMAVNNVYENKSRKLFIINVSLIVISYSIGGAIIALLQ